MVVNSAKKGSGLPQELSAQAERSITRLAAGRRRETLKAHSAASYAGGWRPRAHIIDYSDQKVGNIGWLRWTTFSY